MPRVTIDKDFRRALLDARRMIQEAEKADCNEAETRRRIERIFEFVMGYNPFKHLSRERAVRGAGETEHVDFAIQLEKGDEIEAVVMVEIKRVNIDLAPKHLKQVSSYAINAGCEWILLTNSKDWRLYHVSFGQPPITKFIYGWNVLADEISKIARGFELLSYKSVKKGSLDQLWKKTNVLLPRNMLEAIVSEQSIKDLRRELKRSTGVRLSIEDIIAGVRRLLNEAALSVMEDLRLSLGQTKEKAKRRKRKPKEAASQVEQKEASETQKQDTSTTSPDDRQTEAAE